MNTSVYSLYLSDLIAFIILIFIVFVDIEGFMLSWSSNYVFLVVFFGIKKKQM